MPFGVTHAARLRPFFFEFLSSEEGSKLCVYRFALCGERLHASERCIQVQLSHLLPTTGRYEAAAIPPLPTAL